MKKDTKRYQISSATLKLIIEMLWYHVQLSDTSTSTNPAASSTSDVSRRINPDVRFYRTNINTICQAKLVACLTTGQSPMSTHWMCIQIPITETLTALVTTLYCESIHLGCWNKWIIFQFYLLILVYLQLARVVDVYLLLSHVYSVCTFMSVVHMRYK